jgi:cell wall-associated NlpC family hydrolase
MMKYYRYALILFPLFSWSDNLFVITDRHGKIETQQHLTHHENACLNQKAAEFSLQAMYAELRKQERLAREAEKAKQAVAHIAKATANAQKKGLTYTLKDTEREALLKYAKHFKGGRYKWGGTTPEGFDCSGYVQYLYKKHGIDLPRTALAQSKVGTPVPEEKLQKGDLVFFLTDKKRGIPVTHVGIYLGNGRFIHAASRKKGITISPLEYGHYSDCYVGARRVLPSSV